jgi:hypothetical protein
MKDLTSVKINEHLKIVVSEKTSVNNIAITNIKTVVCQRMK